MEKPFWIANISHMFIEVYLLTQVALIPVFMYEFKLTIIEASLIASIPNLTQLLMYIPLGSLVDRFNAKIFLFSSMLIEGSSALLLSQATSFWMLVLGVSVLKISSPIYHISGLSYISRLTKLKNTHRTMGYHNAFGSLGTAIGVISLSFFLSALNWRWVYLFWAFPILAWGVIIMRSKQLGVKRIKKKRSLKASELSNFRFVLFSGLLTFLIFVGLRETGITGTITFMTTYLGGVRGIPESIATLIFGIGPIMGIMGSLGGGFLGEKMSAKKALSFAILGCMISLIALRLSSQLYLLTLFYFIFSILNYSAYVPMNTIVATITHPKKIGLGFSAYFFTVGSIISITPIILAWIIELTNIWQIFPFGIIFLMSSLIILYFIRYPRNKE